MVVVNRTSGMTEALRGRSEPNQPEPSKLYAQAQEATKDEEWGVSNPYGGQQAAKKIDCSKKPEKPNPSMWMSMPKAERKVFKRHLRIWTKHCEVKKEDPEKCPPKPQKLTLAEFVAMTKEKQEAHLQALKKWWECEIDKAKSLEEGLAKCGEKPKFDVRTDVGVSKKRKAFLRLKAVWRECRAKCRALFKDSKKGKGVKLDFDPLDEQKEDTPEPKKKPPCEPGNPHGKAGIRGPSLFKVPLSEATAQSKKKGW